MKKANGYKEMHSEGCKMKDVSMTEVVQFAYDRAISDLRRGRLPIRDIQDLCHVAHTYALLDLYQGSKIVDPECHYNKPIDKLYEIFDDGAISEGDAYASFAFCYLKVFEIEGVIEEKSFLAQFECEKMKHV